MFVLMLMQLLLLMIAIHISATGDSVRAEQLLNKAIAKDGRLAVACVLLPSQKHTNMCFAHCVALQLLHAGRHLQRRHLH
jgi:hypothetical protein